MVSYRHKGETRMNKLIIALSVACASACVFAADSNAVTPYENLKTTSLDWFDVRATNLSNPIGCTQFGDGSITVDGDAMVVDSELGKPVTFRANNATDKEIVTVTIKMAASTVPELPLLRGAKVAFAISGEDTARKYYVCLGGRDWVALEGTPVVDETDYELVVRFDNRDTTKKVQFALKDGNVETILRNNGAEWSEYGNTAVASQLAVDLVGSGKVAFLTGNQIQIDTEVVVDPDVGRIDVPEADAQLLATAFGCDVKTALGKNAKDEYGLDMKVGTAYAVGLIQNVNGEMKAVAKGIDIKADATAKIGTEIPVKFGDFVPQPPKGVQLKYQLFGNTGSAEWKPVGDQVSEIDAIKIPANDVTGSNAYRYFKVVTTVIPAN